MQEALGVSNGEDAVNAMLSALDTASTDLASVLRFKTFDREARQDDFLVRLDRQPADEPFIKLALARGLVATSPAVTVVAASSQAALTAAPVDILPQVDIDYEKGVVSIPVGVELGDAAGTIFLWVRVGYAAGFTTDDQATYKDVPEWLARAAQLTARLSLNAHPAFVANATATDARLLERQYASIVQGRMRYLPWAALPKASRAV
jgi:hypothetical protein